ncbi:MAG TPA: glycosyltransferase family 4 protein [Candidatus Angelobacter sp.]|nr:glycosyltransferase family 4 protein [Candidatus Angelobacter sp.]
MISTFFTLERFTKGPRILDVDDAIWLYRDGSFVHRLAGISDSVICGNSFLAEHFSRWNSSITILPTAVDTDRFITLASRPANENLTIGWSGGYEGGPDLKVAEAALQIVLNRNPNVRLRVISDQPPCLNLPPGQMEFVRWTPETEVRAIQTLDIGIMPLRDTLWSRGKCAYKMLLYMSCGVPAVVSPVGMCGEVCNLAEVGISAGTTQDWVEALEELLRDTQLRTAMGAKARDIIEQKFSIHQLAPKLAAELARVAERNRN